MKRIIITGATGFIGIHLIKEWLEEDCEIFAVIRPNSKNKSRVPKNEKVHIIELEMKDYDKLISYTKTADFFYHLAWEGARKPYRDNEQIQKRNYKYSLKAFEAAQRLNCSFFLGSGSQAEYGITTGVVDEEYPCKPETEYGKYKLKTYEMLSNRSKEVGIKFIWTRIFSVYGKYDYSGTLIMNCLSKMLKNETIEMTEGNQLWDYVYVKDVAEAMKSFALTNCSSGVYIVASGDYRPLRDFIIEMKKVLNSNSHLAFGCIPFGTGGAINLTPNPQKIKDALNWMPHTSFPEGIVLTMEK